MNGSKHDKSLDPHSGQLEQLRQIIENRLKDEPDKRLIKFLLNKVKHGEKQFIDELLRKMLYIKKHLLKSRPKDKELIEEVIYELLYDDSLTKEQLNDELLGDEQLIEDLLNDKQLIEKIFKEKFVYIPRNPKLEGTMYQLVSNLASTYEFIEVVRAEKKIVYIPHNAKLEDTINQLISNPASTYEFIEVVRAIEYEVTPRIGYVEQHKIEWVCNLLNMLQYEILYETDEQRKNYRIHRLISYLEKLIIEIEGAEQYRHGQASNAIRKLEDRYKNIL